MQIDLCSGGREAIEAIKSKNYDLVFMDHKMPVMDGIEAAAKIFEFDTGVPIIAMTANIFSSDRQIYKENGIDDCVGKPFTSQELWRCLMKYLKPVSWQPVDGNGRAAEDELQRKLTKDFVRDNQNRLGEIETAAKAGDIKLAHRLAHSLKSNAGQLGKPALQQAAAIVEQHLKNGENLVTEEQLNTLETELNAVLKQFTAELEAASGKQADESKDQTKDEQEWLGSQSSLELIEKLEPLLEMGSVQCRKFIDNLRRIHGSEKLIEQMEDLDFERAFVSLAELKKKIEVKSVS
jgi:CheY-like chemotaxis protein